MKMNYRKCFSIKAKPALQRKTEKKLKELVILKYLLFYVDLSFDSIVALIILVSINVVEFISIVSFISLS